MTKEMIDVLLTLWVSLGTFTLGFTATKVGYLRWSDLFVVPFGPLWFVTPYWWNEDGKRMWRRGGRLPMGWRWHFRMTKPAQWLLKAAHRDNTPVWMHDAIERLVYGRHG